MLSMPKPFQNRRRGQDSSDADWLKARRTARGLDRVLDGGRSKREAIARAAAELRLTSRQVYNLLARYRAERTVILSRRSALNVCGIVEIRIRRLKTTAQYQSTGDPRNNAV
ncbi:hypothetical protein F4V91_32625 [Neorhizobium galegae]|uniref:Helix-turn-helix domain-containing protein n=1 Tax=Neorhizobium galegae TaxID=399 RepID=A0A6A1TFH3_NEOGA|nr:hypothetical protein F4V91_32625 [Neorhizobium galegae]